MRKQWEDRADTEDLFGENKINANWLSFIGKIEESRKYLFMPP